jgi:peroxiredoxin
MPRPGGPRLSVTGTPVAALAPLLAALALSCTPVPPPADDDREAATGAAGSDQLFAYDPVARPLGIGEAVPDFPLFDAAGEPLPLSRLRGSIVVLTFFTAVEGRRLDAAAPTGKGTGSEILDRFAELQASLAPGSAPAVRAIGVLLDASPQAADLLAGLQGAVPFTLARAAPPAASPMATAFGVALWESAGGQARQTYNTVVIDRRGRLADQFLGLDAWSAMDAVAAISAVAGRD